MTWIFRRRLLEKAIGKFVAISIYHIWKESKNSFSLLGKASLAVGETETEFLLKSHGRRTSSWPRAKRAPHRTNTGDFCKSPQKKPQNFRKVFWWYFYTPKLELFSKKTFEESFRFAPLSALKFWRNFSSKTEKFSLHFFDVARPNFFWKGKENFLFWSSENSERRKANIFRFLSFCIFGRPWPKPTRSRTATWNSH